MQEKALLDDKKQVGQGGNEIGYKNMGPPFNNNYNNRVFNIEGAGNLHTNNEVSLRRVCCPTATVTKVFCSLSVFLILVTFSLAIVRITMNWCEFWGNYDTCSLNGDPSPWCCYSYARCQPSYYYSCYPITNVQTYSAIVGITVPLALTAGLALLSTCLCYKLWGKEKENQRMLGNPITNYIRLWSVIYLHRYCIDFNTNMDIDKLILKFGKADAQISIYLIMNRSKLHWRGSIRWYIHIYI